MAPANSNERPSLLHRIGRPVDGASLAVFRMAVGALMLWEMSRFFRYGWIDAQFVEPKFHFTFYGFEWIRPLPANGMYVVFGILSVAAIGVFLGLFYRWVINLIRHHL